MLTKIDLSQIREIVHEEVDVIVEEKLNSKLKLELEPIKKDLKYLKKKVNKIDKTVNLIVTNYDEADVKLERRVKKIEQHLALPQEI